MATLLLISGRSGGMGPIVDGHPTSPNFLIRSRDYFIQAGFDVAVLGIPSDGIGLGGGDGRISDAHMEDLRRVVQQLKAATGLPVWAIGTSMGTISAAAAAIAFGQEELAGIVLTSSITSKAKPGAVPFQNLSAIRIPVLVLHHAFDNCKYCVPKAAEHIADSLVNAPIKKFATIEGGNGGDGDTCGPWSHHGYIGIEQEAVRLVTDWIKNPTP